jgi:predicted O-linked N-acetylglucosamine transferase (SPINDLY family)
VSNPFPLLAMSDDPMLHRQASEIFAHYQYPSNSTLGPIAKHPKGEKIRIGYFSADFHNHATGYLLAELIELHDKIQFELIGISFGPNQDDEMRIRLQQSFDQLIDASTMSDIEIAQLSRDLKIDIAVDLKGFTQNCRTGIFAYRAAPIQLSYLGYPGTMSTNYIDYLIADRTLIPQEAQQAYSEKIAYLPNSYQANDRKRVISDKRFTKGDLGLPEQGFIFCSFNNNYKILPATFEIWMRILKAVDASVLWLYEDNAAAADHLRQEAEKRGVHPSRLVFAKRMPLAEHLARHQLADLFIDAFPCNAHTTASDALWAGLPVLTLMGNSFASRVAASLLKAIELPELITSTPQSYEALAIEIAKNPAKLAALKQKLASNRLTTPLFDTPQFTKDLEQSYVQIYERYQAGLPPEHIFV